MSVPTIHFTHDASHTVMNRWQAARIVLTTLCLYAIAWVLIDPTASPLRHLLGIASLVLFSQLAHRSPFQHIHLSLRCVTEDGSETPDMTTTNWSRIVRVVRVATTRTLRTTPSVYSDATVDLDISPTMFHDILVGNDVPLPMQMSMGEAYDIEDDTEDTPY